MLEIVTNGYEWLRAIIIRFTLPVFLLRPLALLAFSSTINPLDKSILDGYDMALTQHACYSSSPRGSRTAVSYARHNHVRERSSFSLWEPQNATAKSQGFLTITSGCAKHQSRYDPTDVTSSATARATSS